MHKFANPGRFLRLSQRLLPWLSLLAIGLLGWGCYQALVVSPADYQQGDSVRIMYVHVPAAWMATIIYASMVAGSLSFLIWRHPLGDVMARASAPIGAVFTLLTLVTGSLWGKPMWGAWWVWDARLTSVLILFFIYLGYIALAQNIDYRESGKKVLAVLTLVGAVNLPIIKFSVEWWNTLHQPASIIREGGPAIHASMQLPLYSMIGAFFLMYLALMLLRMQTLLLKQKVKRIRSIA